MSLSDQTQSKQLPLISVIVPAYNEQALLEEHVEQVVAYLDSMLDRFDWELLIVNDGSSDSTGEIADCLASRHHRIRALHHPCNFGLGQVFKFGFANAKGDYIVTLDADLSYDVRHIIELVDKIRTTHAKIVLASPYMEGGSIRSVPWIRRILSILGNRFLSVFARGKFSTLTSIVRVYDGPFIRSLDLRSMGMDIMPEMLYKAMVVRAKIEEIPGRLDWSHQQRFKHSRTSSMRVFYHVLSTVLSGFLFRPFLFFVAPGVIIGLFALYVDIWMFRHYFESLTKLRLSGLEYTFSKAFADAFATYPHTFITGFLVTMLAIQLIGMGVMALQNMRYFEDLYHLNSSELKKLRKPVEPANHER